jgi:hypothetical protein
LKDPARAVRLYDRLRTEWTQLSPPEQWSLMFQDLEPYEFDITFTKNTDPTSLYLHAELWEEVPSWVKSRVGREGTLVFSSSPRNTLGAIWMTEGSNFKNSKYMRMLKHYINFGLKRGKKEPIITVGSEMSIKDGIDCMSGPRIHTLLMGFWNEKLKKLPEKVNYEVCEKIFQDPYFNMSFIKKTTSTLKQLVFARATRGQVIQWSPILNKSDHLEGFSVNDIANMSRMDNNGDLIPFNDTTYYALMSAKIIEGLSDLKKHGYVELAAYFENEFLNKECEVTDAKMNALTMLNAIEGYGGFTRTEVVLSIKKQIEKESESPVNPGYLPELKGHLEDFVQWAVKYRKFPTEREWYVRLLSALNSNSAGGAREEYEFMSNGKLQKFIASDKTLVFAADPSKYISKEEFDRACSVVNPGRLTTRDVFGGRDTRAVWMIALVIYLYETAWGFPMLEYLTKQVDDVSFGEVGMEAHKLYLYATSVPWLFNVLKDFSKYDTTQEWDNARGPFAKLLTAALDKAGVTETIGALGTLSEVHWAVAKKLRDAVFDLGNGELVSPQQKHSGELNTANDNSILNISEDDYEERIMDERAPELRAALGNRLHRSVLGDDSIKNYRANRHITLELHQKWGEVSEAAAAECGFDLNRLKVVRRDTYGEYLKVLYSYGHVIPQLGRLMVFSSERVNVLLDPIETMRGLFSFFRTVIARGGDHWWCIRFLNHVWNIRRGVRRGFFKNTEQANKFKGPKFIDYPFAAIWTPQALGGVGELPHTIIGASKDALIYLWSQKYPGLYDLINDAAHVLDFNKSDPAKDIVQDIRKSGRLDKFEKWIKERVDDQSKHQRMNDERKRYPHIKLGDMDYEFMIPRRIQKTIEGTSKVNKLSIHIKQRQVSRMRNRYNIQRTKDYLDDVFGWLDDIIISSGDILPDKQSANVVSGLDPSVGRFERVLGFSTRSNDQRGRMTKLFNTLTDNTFSPIAEFSVDSLLSLFTRPDIYPSVEKIASVAIRIGANPDKAVSFANLFVQSFDSALILHRGQKFSSGDEFGSTLDLSYGNILRVIDLPEWVIDHDMAYLVRQVAIMSLLTTPFFQPLRKQIVKFSGDDSTALSKLNPKFHSPNKHFMSAFPVNTWY